MTDYLTREEIKRLRGPFSRFLTAARMHQRHQAIIHDQGVQLIHDICTYGELMDRLLKQALSEPSRIYAARHEERERCMQEAQRRTELFPLEDIQLLQATRPERIAASLKHLQAQIEHLREQVADLEPADMTGWRPIAEAPHGVEVLLYCPDRGIANKARVELGYASHGSRDGAASSVSYHAWATHWMPLPDAPAEPASAESGPESPQAQEPPEPIIKAVERALDECSAWIARPSPEVTKRVATAAGIAALLHLQYDQSRAVDLEFRLSALEAENARLREREKNLEGELCRARAALRGRGGGDA